MQAIAPDAHGIAVLLLIVVALFLFTRDGLPLESSSLAILIVLVAGFQIFPYEVDGAPLGPDQFLSGFGNEALIAICSLIMVGKALETTGALQPLATIVSSTWSTRPLLALMLMLVAVAVLSAFINGTPIAVLMIPILVGISMRAKTPVSGIMLPMGLATIIGGMSTSIGISTNLLVVDIAEDMGLARIGMFDFVMPVLIVGGTGLMFVWLIAPKLLPARDLPMADTAPRVFHAQLFINEDSFAAGKALSEVLARATGQMWVDRLQCSESLFLAKLPSVKLQPGDRLFVRDSPDNLKRFEDLLGATLYNISDTAHPIDDRTPLKEQGQHLAELVVTHGSPLHLRSLAAARFSAIRSPAASNSQSWSANLTGRRRSEQHLSPGGRCLARTGQPRCNRYIEVQRRHAGCRRHHRIAARTSCETGTGRIDDRGPCGSIRTHTNFDQCAHRCRAAAGAGLPELVRRGTSAAYPGHHDYRDQPCAR